MRLLLAFVPLVLASGCSDPAASTPANAVEAGWTVRIDLDKDAEPDRFRMDDGCVEVTAGDNATLWHPVHRGDGSFRLAAAVTHLDSGLHPHGAGLVFGGTKVDGLDQSYTYFLVRCDRQFLIKTRRGSETADVVAWTAHDAVAAEDDKRVTHNELAVEVDGSEVRFVINGTVVHRAKPASLPTAGRCGFRLVHDLHVRFGPLALEAPGQ